MNDKDFQKLVESVKQMGGIMRGENIPLTISQKIE